MKKVAFLGASKSHIKSFQEKARTDAGHQLWLVQLGRDPDDWKPMPSVGPGAREIRLHSPHEYRVIYVAQFGESVYVLHAFMKKTQKTSRHDIEIARAAYAEAKNRHQKTQRKR